MSDFITLSCPSCGAALQVTQDLERFACSRCGNEHIVKRAGGTVSLAPVVAQLSRVQAGVDKTAAELAIARLQREIQALEAHDTSEESRTSGIARGSTLSLLMAAGGIYSILAGSPYPGWIILGLLLILAGAAGLFLMVMAVRNLRNSRRGIRNAIAARRRELDHNRALVAK